MYGLYGTSALTRISQKEASGMSKQKEFGPGEVRIAMVVCNKYIVLIRPKSRDYSHRSPVYWRFPGGRVEVGETARQAAIRESKEETGNEKISEDELTGLAAVEFYTHTLYFFAGHIDASDLAEFGSEGEEIKISHLDELEGMADFMPKHRELIRGLERR